MVGIIARGRRVISAIGAALAAAALLAAMCGALGVGAAYAGGYSLDLLKGKASATFYSKAAGLGAHAYYAVGDSAGKEISDVKSSNKKVATATAMKADDGTCYIALNAKKKGTATISFRLGGKAYKTKHTVAKYSNPFKSLKVGKSDYAKKVSFTGYDCRANVKAKALGGKIKITPASGWKLDGKVTAFTPAGSKDVANGAKVKDASSLWLTMRKEGVGSIRVIVQAQAS